MKKPENWLLGILLLLALIVALQHRAIRALELQINQYAEECTDRSDAPQPSLEVPK